MSGDLGPAGLRVAYPPRVPSNAELARRTPLARESQLAGRPRSWARRPLLLSLAVEVGPDQRLAVAVWQVRRYGRLVVEGCVLPDEGAAPEVEAEARDWDARPSAARLSRNASGRLLHRLSDWRETVLRPYVLGTQTTLPGTSAKAWLVGWEAAWDLSRLARSWVPGKGARNWGGWSFGMFGHPDDPAADGYPRCFARQLGDDTSIVRWAGMPKGAPRPGPIIGGRQLVRALAGNGLSILSPACEEFEVVPPMVAGSLLDRLADRARAIGELAEKCFAEADFWEQRRGPDRKSLRPAGILADPRRLYSGGGLFRGLREAMGLPSLGERVVEGPLGHDRVVGAFAAAQFGGRTEAFATWERKAAEHWDFSATHAHVGRLIGLSGIYCGSHLVGADITSEARAELGRLRACPDLVAEVLDPAWWRRWAFVVLRCSLTGSLLPVRVPSRGRPGEWSVRLAPVTTADGVTLWHPFFDLVAALLLDPSGPAPTIHEAIGLEAQGELPLYPVMLPSGVTLGPSDDIFEMLLAARAACESHPGWTARQRSRRVAGLKGLYTSGTTGVTARVDRDPVPEKVRRRKGFVRPEVIGPDGERHLAPAGARYIERPGPDNFAPAATAVHAGARLLLALAQRLAEDQGGRVFQVLVDALTVEAGADMALVAKRLHEGLGVTLRPQHGSDRQPVEAWVGGRNRYILARRGQVVHGAETHLGGVYLDPSGRGDAPGPTGARAWVEDAHRAVLRGLTEVERAARTGAGQPAFYVGDLPAWGERMAVSFFRASVPEQLAWLGEGAWPFDEGLAAHHHGFSPSKKRGGPVVRAPWSTSPEDWAELPWRFRDGEPAEVVEATGYLPPPGSFVPATIAAVVGRWALSGEPGKRAVSRSARFDIGRGPLEPLSYEATATALIGAEGAELAERPRGTAVAEAGELVLLYGGSADADLPGLCRLLRAMTSEERRQYFPLLTAGQLHTLAAGNVPKGFPAIIRQAAQEALRQRHLSEGVSPLVVWAEVLERCRAEGCGELRDGRSPLCATCRRERNRLAVAKSRGRHAAA